MNTKQLIKVLKDESFFGIAKNKAFVVDGKHIVIPLGVYNNAFKVVKMDGVTDEEN